MVRPYPDDVRVRVVSAVLEGKSCRCVAARFGIAVSSVVKWSQRARQTGSVSPKKMGGRRPVILATYRSLVFEQIMCTPDITIRSLQRLLAARGVPVSQDSVWRFLQREGLRLKKK